MNRHPHTPDGPSETQPGAAGGTPTGTGPGTGVIPAGESSRADPGMVQTPPLGTIAGGAGGAAVSAVARDPAREQASRSTDPVAEHAYWSEHFQSRPYVEPGANFDDYGPAYKFGVSQQGRHGGEDFDELEAELSGAWSTDRGASRLSWDEARPAVRDAWDRVGSTR